MKVVVKTNLQTNSPRKNLFSKFSLLKSRSLCNTFGGCGIARSLGLQNQASGYQLLGETSTMNKAKIVEANKQHGLLFVDEGSGRNKARLLPPP